MQPAFEAYRGEEPFAFLSYARSDAETVIPDAEWLYECGVRVWYDGEIRGGERWANTIRQKIRGCSVVLLFLSKAAFRENTDEQSESYVYTEIALASAYKKPFIVIALEPLTLPSRIAAVSAWQTLPRDAWDKARYLTRLRDDALAMQLAARRVNPWKKLFDADTRRFETLLEFVQTIDKALIGGFLTPTLTDGVEIDPPMSAVWPNGRSRDLPAGFSRKEFYRDCGLAPRLVITGGAGSGKSIQMLKFVDALLPRGGRLSLASVIPVVLNASSWIDDPIQMRNKEKTFRHWVEAQLLSRYGIPRAVSTDLIENFQLIYCIDGFDELGRQFGSSVAYSSL